MKFLVFFSSFLLLFSSCASKIGQTPQTAASFITLSYEVTTEKPLAEGQTVFVAGSDEALGNWQPNKVALTRLTSTTFRGSVKLPSKKQVEYKFTRGAWTTEQTLASGTIPANQCLKATADTTVRITITHWKDEYFKPKGQVTGRVTTIKAWKGTGIEPRNVHIWLPPNYDSTGKTRYAVIYCHDGQNVFDPATSSFGIDWSLDETADSLIHNGVCRPFLMVAMDCTKQRTAEYAYEKQGQNYQKWVVEQVKPFIDAHYATFPDAKNTAILGSSMGGLCAFELAWNYPSVFGHAACFSPAFRIKKVENTTIYALDYIPLAQKATDFKPIDLYIDNGTIDLEAPLQPGIDDMLRFLDSRKQPYVWFLAKGEPHNEAAWSRRAWRPFTQFFPKE